MGCDIHPAIERRLSANEWATWERFQRGSGMVWSREGGEATGWIHRAVTNRNYTFFAALAGVRGRGPAPRGLPADVAPLTRRLSEQWGSDGHSHSWLTLAEFLPLYVEHHIGEHALVECTKWALHPDADLPAPMMQALDDLCVSIEDREDIAEYRVVFWFDN